MQSIRFPFFAAAILAAAFVSWSSSPAFAAQSKLIDAVKSGDKAAVRAALKTSKVNERQGDGTTALAWAVHRDDLETADLLIKAGADVNLANDYGIGPLSLACSNANSAMVDRLLRAGADPNKAQWTGETPLMTCASTKATQAVKSLLVKGADVNAAENKDGQTPLMWAAAAGQVEMVRAMVEHGAKVSARTKLHPMPEPFIVTPSVSAFNRNYPPTTRFRKASGGFTPFLFAAQNGDIPTAEALLAAGADINDRTEEEGTALLIAIASGHEKLALWLIEKGADVNAAEANGITALHFAVHTGIQNLAGMMQTPSDKFGWLRPNHPELVKVLLAKGANPHTRIKNSLPFLDDPFIGRTTEDFHQVDITGSTPFLLAAASGDVEIMKILVAAGVDPRVMTFDGVNAVMMAAGLGTERGKGNEKNYLEAAKYAIELGVNVNHAKDDGRTAMHAAVVHGWSDMIKLLVANGAKIDPVDTYGQTPLSMALGDPGDFVYRILPGGNFDERFRIPRENPKLAELLLALGHPPYTGPVTDKSGR